MIVSGFRAALDLDTYPLSNLIRPLCAERAKPGRGKPVLIMHNYWLFCLFSRHISRTQQNRHINFHALVALKLLVSLISHLVAYSARIVVDRHTHTNRQTHRPSTVTRDALINCLHSMSCNWPYKLSSHRENNIHMQLSTLEKYKNRNSYGGRTRSVETSAKF